MIARILPRPTAARAAAILREIFGRIQAPVAFRLWDGSEVRLAGDKPLCAVVIKSAETFLRLILHPRPYDFALAYVNSAIDFEGDLFAIMPVANEVEELRVPLWLKIRLLASLWKG
jgi:hypothetical protein